MTKYTVFMNAPFCTLVVRLGAQSKQQNSQMNHETGGEVDAVSISQNQESHNDYPSSPLIVSFFFSFCWPCLSPCLCLYEFNQVSGSSGYPISLSPPLSLCLRIDSVSLTLSLLKLPLRSTLTTAPRLPETKTLANACNCNDAPSTIASLRGKVRGDFCRLCQLLSLISI